MPTHDVRPWLPQALESVLRQDVDGMEVIVVDDHSTDGTPELVADVAARDGRVRLIRAESAGGGSARNRGVEEARGRYLVFCDGDDLVPDGAYRALLDSLERSGSDLAVGDYLKFRAVHTWRPTDAMPAFDRAAQGIAVRDEPTLLFSRPCWNRAFRRSFWDRAGIAFPDVPRSNDIVPMVTAYLAAERIDVLPDVVYVYRERPGDGSMSARATAAASLLSYLGQETACAAAVAATGDPGLSRAYGALVWDRDGYVHVARHVLTRRRAQGDDAAIAAAVRGLLAQTTEPESGLGGERVHPLRRLAMVLAAGGELAASGTVVRLLEVDPSAEVRGDDAIDDWTLLLDRLSDSSLVRDDARELLAERFARQATAPHSAAAAVRWRALMRAARRVLGERALMFSPEARASVPGDAQRARRRGALEARVESVSGGEVLVLRGTIAADDVSGRWRPVLFDGLRAAEGAPVIEAAEVEWTAAGDGRLAWSARFPAGALPMHRPLRPAVAAPGTGEVLAMGGPAAPPAYEPRDRFLYDRIDGVLVVRRRRHWAPRALRRAAIVALRRLRPPR
ncbi:hypothetical protein GCM10022202_11450 [Microbacterium marinilacus]|uniref:Glycosyltransferase 2-like domain-containing protein n=2 Tax=Microbacterium marinilacus TaxID=415209 RepID=A0ABP7BAE5_9MICO